MLCIGKVTAGLAYEMAAYRRENDLVTCEQTACTPGSLNYLTVGNLLILFR